jgi:hypothetical protein
MFHPKFLTSSLAALATVGVLATATACAGPASAPQSMLGPVQSSAKATSARTPSPKQADKATQVHMKITNSTAETLTMSSAQDKGKNAHWQDRPTDLAPGQTETVSNYSAGDAEIDVTYTGGTDGAVFTLHGKTPLVGSNEATGSSSSTSYTVGANGASGYNPTFTYSIEPGHTFSYTGQTETYTVPAGVTQLNVTAVGGVGGDDVSFEHLPNGAQVSGVLAVTPGEALTVGVAGDGGGNLDHARGGWGLTNGGDSYSGGAGAVAPGDDADGGGGATVVLDGSDHVVVVAGGGGGSGSGNDAQTGHAGGRGGYNGSWTGEDGLGDGGKAGAASGTQGQAVPGANGGTLVGGAGGGGVAGGLAGPTGNGAGGGAGSSAAPGLTGATVETAPVPSGNSAPSLVTFSAVS